jgi:RNA polymerase sigma-70 factor (ECF subfamily)
MEEKFLADRFEANRGHLRAVAYRMLGSHAEAEDAVQEAWIRLSRSDTSGVENLAGWLTTVVGRVCLDMLRSRSSRREDPLDDRVPERADEASPEQEAVLADSVGLALLVVLDTLEPAERLAFVLHDMFGVPFDEIATIVGRTPAAARQLASRARRRVQGKESMPEPDLSRQRQVVDAFLAASRGGQFDTLLAILDPDVVFRTDAVASRMGASSQTRGANEVAGFFSGRAEGAELAILDGVAVGAVVRTPKGKVRIALKFTLENDRIVAIDVTADPKALADMDFTVL